jgi:ankyrin repeat protein
MHGHLAIVQSVLKALQQQQQQQHVSRSPLSSPISSPSSKLAAARRSRDSTTPPVSPRGGSSAQQQQQQPGALQQQQQQHVVALSPKGAGAVPGVDARNSNGDTPLMFAASSGHMGIVAALLNVSRWQARLLALLTGQGCCCVRAGDACAAVLLPCSSRASAAACVLPAYTL